MNFSAFVSFLLTQECNCYSGEEFAVICFLPVCGSSSLHLEFCFHLICDIYRMALWLQTSYSYLLLVLCYFISIAKEKAN